MSFEQAVTKHGMPLYVFPMPHVKSVALGVLVFAGTRDEKWPKEAGLAHAFEHMVFQGNSRLVNSGAIGEEIEVLGGDVNAWTWKEMTFYYRVVPDHALTIAVRSLASQITSSLFESRNVKKEMKNIVEEIKRAQDDPAGVCQEAIEEVIFGDHPLGKDTLGTIKSVTGFKRADFLRWQKRFYHPENYVFIAVGNTTLEKALAVINRTSFGKKTGNLNTRTPRPQINKKNNIKIIERDIEQANVCLGVAVDSASDESTRALTLYCHMIDGGMSFPMFQEVRDKRGLCYAVSANLTPWSDHGVFNVYVGTDANRINEAIDCIKKVIWNCRANHGLFEKAKRLLLGRNAISFCNPSAILNQAAQEITFSGSPKSPEEIGDEIKKIDLSDVIMAVERYLKPDNFSYAYVVPKGTKI